MKYIPNNIFCSFVLFASLAASAFGADVGNFVWNGGFEESNIYWANWTVNNNPPANFQCNKYIWNSADKYFLV